MLQGGSPSTRNKGQAQLPAWRPIADLRLRLRRQERWTRSSTCTRRCATCASASSHIRSSPRTAHPSPLAAAGCRSPVPASSGAAAPQLGICARSARSHHAPPTGAQPRNDRLLCAHDMEGNALILMYTHVDTDVRVFSTCMHRYTCTHRSAQAAAPRSRRVPREHTAARAYQREVPPLLSSP